MDRRQHIIQQLHNETQRNMVTASALTLAYQGQDPIRVGTRHTPPLPIMLSTLKTGGDPFNHPKYTPHTYLEEHPHPGQLLEAFDKTHDTLQQVGLITNTGQWAHNTYQTLEPHQQQAAEYAIRTYHHTLNRIYRQYHRAPTFTRPVERLMSRLGWPYSRALWGSMYPRIRDGATHHPSVYPPAPNQQVADTLTRRGIYPSTPGGVAYLYWVFMGTARKYHKHGGRTEILVNMEQNLTETIATLCSWYDTHARCFSINMREVGWLLRAARHVMSAYEGALVLTGGHHQTRVFDAARLVESIYQVRYTENITYQELLELPPQIAATIITSHNDDLYRVFSRGLPHRDWYTEWVRDWVIPTATTNPGLNLRTCATAYFNFHNI